MNYFTDICFISAYTSITAQQLCHCLKTKWYTIEFIHTRPFDNNGYLYYLATERLEKEWQNPSKTEKIKLSASSINPLTDYADIHSFASCTIKPSTFFTSYEVPGPSWIQIDLLDNPPILLNYYSLHSSSTGGPYALRTWQLQGSNDGKYWTVLSDHRNDQSLVNDRFNPKSWKIPYGVAPFRYFRIYADCPQQNCNHLSKAVTLMSVGGIELYGTVYKHFH
jgi:hypothetical protein